MYHHPIYLSNYYHTTIKFIILRNTSVLDSSINLSINLQVLKQGLESVGTNKIRRTVPHQLSGLLISLLRRV